MTCPVPVGLVGAHKQWVAAGCPRALASTWRRERWEAAGVPVPDDLTDDSITRDVATEYAKRIRVGDRQSAQDAFVVAMIWGHGLTGYGPDRVRKIMDCAAFADQLAELTEKTLQRGGAAAYELVHRRRSERRPGAPDYLAGPGAAFGTKYIYFLTRAHHEERVAPVLDAVAIAPGGEQGPRLPESQGRGRCHRGAPRPQRLQGASHARHAQRSHLLHRPADPRLPAFPRPGVGASCGWPKAMRLLPA